MNDITTIPEPTVIELDPSWFKHAYYVYLVAIERVEGNLLYIGMTGDRKHKMARSPFYRMAGHFKLTQSTENQIVKGLRKHYGVADDEQERLVEILVSSKIAYYAYPLAKFSFDIVEADHKELRRRGERIESSLIRRFVNEKNWTLLNRQISLKPDDNADRIAALIYTDFLERL